MSVRQLTSSERGVYRPSRNAIITGIIIVYILSRRIRDVHVKKQAFRQCRLKAFSERAVSPAKERLLMRECLAKKSDVNILFMSYVLN